MKGIAFLTSSGDALLPYAAVHGAVTRANQLEFEMVGTIKVFNDLVYPREPHIHFNPLYRRFPRTMLSTGVRRFLLRAMWGQPCHPIKTRAQKRACCIMETIK